jgi:hypothetical protein
MATQDLLEFAGGMFSDVISDNVYYRVRPIVEEKSPHLDELELERFDLLLKSKRKKFKDTGVVGLLHFENRVPYYINMDILTTSRAQTVVELLISRRFRTQSELRNVDKYIPFHCSIELPVGHIEGEKFRVNSRKKSKSWSQRILG